MPPSVSPLTSKNAKVDSGSSGVAGEEDLNHSERLMVRAADIVDRLAGLASFSKAAGTSRELEVSRSDVEYEYRLWICLYSPFM